MTTPLITNTLSDLANLTRLIEPLNRALATAQAELDAVSELDPVADAPALAATFQKVSREFVGLGDFSRLSREVNAVYTNTNHICATLRTNHADRMKRQQAQEAAERAQAEAAEAARLAQIASEQAEAERTVDLLARHGFVVTRA